MKENIPDVVQDYINKAPVKAKEILIDLFMILKGIAPEADVQLKWGIPVFIEKRILFSFAAFKNHFNFTPTGPTLKVFEDKLDKYTTKQDSIQFKYDGPLPIKLIEEIAKYRRIDVIENDAKWKY